MGNNHGYVFLKMSLFLLYFGGSKTGKCNFPLLWYHKYFIVSTPLAKIFYFLLSHPLRVKYSRCVKSPKNIKTCGKVTVFKDYHFLDKKLLNKMSGILYKLPKLTIFLCVSHNKILALFP